ncbi:MAG: MBOAT family protein [Lachnospiraceae bacterium]|nr:MBOAT family protein [Lachnospiraceae bacterium]
MIFSSLIFLLYFLPAFFFLYWVFPEKYRNFALLAGSAVFYGYGAPERLVPILVLTVVNFWLGLAFGRKIGPIGEESGENGGGKKSRHIKPKLILSVGVAFNVGALVYFRMRQVSLPGISFYTFTMIAYLADVYRKKIPREVRLSHLTTYAVMFPKMLCGPITRYGELKAEVSERKFDANTVQEGLGLFILGLTYKVLLADRIGYLWNQVHTIGYENLSTPYAWLAAVAYSMQIYLDFQGYSLMAVGLGRMLGFHLPENFHEPYMATGIRDFYRRWHMTLGGWFRDYVYIPLGGSRKGRLRTVVNLFAVWLLTSLWHGFGINFLMWGGLLWLFIVWERFWVGTKLAQKLKGLRFLVHPYVWAVIPVTWVCFAITDPVELYTYLGRMFGVVPGVNVKATDWLRAIDMYRYQLIACLVACTPVVRILYGKLKETIVCKLALAMAFWFCVWRLSLAGNNPFMYLNF